MTIDEKQLTKARLNWGNGMIAISEAYDESGITRAKAIADDFLDDIYGFELGPVLFKPTLAADQQFRSTFDDALSYFVASNNACPEDKGFAIKGWTAVRFENVDILTDGNVGMAMGNYFFTTPEGDEVKVEYSFGYTLDDAGNVRINLHHSSMPYAP